MYPARTCSDFLLSSTAHGPLQRGTRLSRRIPTLPRDPFVNKNEEDMILWASKAQVIDQASPWQARVALVALPEFNIFFLSIEIFPFPFSVCMPQVCNSIL